MVKLLNAKIKLIKSEVKIINLLLSLIVALFIANAVIESTALMYFSVVYTYILIAITPQNYSMAVVLFLLPNAGFFDGLGFTYLFNFSIAIYFVKIVISKIFSHEAWISKEFLGAVILMIYALLLLLIKGVYEISSSSLFSTCSLFISFFAMILSVNNVRRFEYDFLYNLFWIGFIVSCFAGLISAINQWGFNLPTTYRFIGMMRDANYYAVNALVLIFGNLLKKHKSILQVLIITVFGFLSISKMFMLVFAVGIIVLLFLKLVHHRNQNMKIRKNKFIVGALICCIIILALLIFGNSLIDFVFERYVFRFFEYSLLTGRDEIQYQYLVLLFSDPVLLFFGASPSYHMVLNVVYAGELMVAHNTYMDVLLSYGLIGGFLFLWILLSTIKKQKRFTNISLPESKTMIFIFILVLFTLSFLMADNFYVLIFFIVVALCTRKNEENFNKGILTTHDY